MGECELPTQFGDFKLRAYRTGALDGSVHEPTVVIAGDVSGDDVVVRVHDQVSGRRRVRGGGGEGAEGKRRR